MRRIVMFNRISADGFFATPEGALDWAVPEPQMDAEIAAGLDPQKTGAMIFGRKTYEMFAAFWPKAVAPTPDDSETAPDPHAPRRTKELHAMGVWLNAAQKWVASRTLQKASWSGTEIVREIDHATIERIKAEAKNDLMIFGSGSIVSRLTELGCIDEWRLVVSPLFLARGRSIFAEMKAPAKVELAEAKAYPNGNVLLRYVRVR
jgi:dihydrofolate reductase